MVNTPTPSAVSPSWLTCCCSLLLFAARVSLGQGEGTSGKIFLLKPSNVKSRLCLSFSKLSVCGRTARPADTRHVHSVLPRDTATTAKHNHNLLYQHHPAGCLFYKTTEEKHTQLENTASVLSISPSEIRFPVTHCSDKQ